MAQEWYYAHADRKVGPVSSSELKQSAADGSLNPTDLVWTEGMKKWEEARSIKGLAGKWPMLPTASTSPPPLPIRQEVLAAKSGVVASPPEPASTSATSALIIQKGWLIGLSLFFCFPVGLILVWKHPGLRDRQSGRFPAGWVCCSSV